MSELIPNFLGGVFRQTLRGSEPSPCPQHRSTSPECVNAPARAFSFEGNGEAGAFSEMLRDLKGQWIHPEIHASLSSLLILKS